MIAVIDCSAGIEVALEKAKFEILQKRMDSCEKVIAPDFFRIETANVLWKYYRAGEIESDVVFRLQMRIGELPDDFVLAEELVVEALQESLRLDHPVYDTLYLVLARRSHAVLLTLDYRLRQLAMNEGITVFPE